MPATDIRDDSGEAIFETTAGTLLEGRIRFTQPRHGYRAAIDPVFLAAAVAPAQTGEHWLELGCGAGAALLCLAWRRPDLRLTGLERNPAMAALAATNLAANGFAERATVVTGDLRTPPAALLSNSLDGILANPPYLEDGRHTPSPQARQAQAHGEGDTSLAEWIAAAHRLLRPRGALVLIHRADRLDQLLATLHPRFGALCLIPLWPKPGSPARRMLVTAHKGRRTPLTLAAGVTLHRADGGYTAEADAILREGRALG